MSKPTSRTARLTAMASYLEQEFPGRVKAAQDNEFMISHKGIDHRVVLDPKFLKQCPDFAQSLRETELADYLREAQSQARRFVVMWSGSETRIRSTSL